MSDIKKGTHTTGSHRVMERADLKLRDRTERRDGQEFPTLSQARKAANPGTVIVRSVDGEVVSVK